MTAQTMPSALDPLSSSMLNKLHEAQPPTKKRKTEQESPAGQSSSTSILIRAPATSLSNEPLVFTPITKLPRSKLPLSWLEDASWSSSNAPPSGLFVADIPALESELSACAEASVLAVRHVADGGLFVVERVKRGIYSLSRLARWVHEGDVLVAVKGWQQGELVDANTESHSTVAIGEDGSNWWEAARIEEPPSDLGLGDELEGLQVSVVFEDDERVDAGTGEASFVDVLEHRSQSLAPASKSFGGAETSFSQVDSQASFVMDAMGADTAAEAPGLDIKQSPAELLDGMRDHYLQTLYVSKTSLAYFAKGPLSRCRNAFQSGAEQSQSCTLIEFYREAILAAKKMDIKYRETLPIVVRDAMLAVSDDDAGAKKRKSKKKKLGRNGLYPEEHGLVHKWWKARVLTESSGVEISREAESKKHISDLRLRETQLQILLILEVLALEISAKNESRKNSDNAGEEKEIAEKPKAKKPQDLNVLLELHLDRMCIWHAVSSEETSGADSAKTSSFNEDHLSGKKAESDDVRDFCTEVVVPFYAARLPDKCKLITRKFGVSSGISPISKKSSSRRERHEPGSDVSRQPPQQKSRRSFHRVLTDQKAATASQTGHPTLTRSNTAPTKPDAKRDLRKESMEPLLPVRGSNVRGGIQQAKRTENREVDLNAVVKQHESKLRRSQILADQKKELDAAILTLRKPNRELVAKDIAEDATKRVSSGGGSSRKSKNPVRNPLGQGVQVMATPRGNRKKDVIGLPPLPRTLGPSRSFAGEMPEQSLAESPVMIPSSGRRAISFSGPDSDPFKSGRAVDSEQRKRKADHGSIQETPTRPPSRLFFDANKPSPSTNKGTSLFRVPELPESRSSTKNLAANTTIPSTPDSSRRKDIFTSSPEVSKPSSQLFREARSSMIMETPPKQKRSFEEMSAPQSLPVTYSARPPTIPTRVSSPPAIAGTPVKAAAMVPVTPDKSQSKSIYEQLGWDDDEMEF